MSRVETILSELLRYQKIPCSCECKDGIEVTSFDKAVDALNKYFIEELEGLKILADNHKTIDSGLFKAIKYGEIIEYFNQRITKKQSEYKEEFKETSICDTAPFVSCNGANGCDTCEYQKEEE